MLERIPTPAKLIADRAYDARKLRDWLAERGCEPVIPPNPTRKHPHRPPSLSQQPCSGGSIESGA
jgi:transposase